MDLEMPRTNGRRALERFEEIAPGLAARTVIMSGGSTDGDLRAWFHGLGPGRVLLKPFSKGALLDVLAHVLAR